MQSPPIDPGYVAAAYDAENWLFSADPDGRDWVDDPARAHRFPALWQAAPVAALRGGVPLRWVDAMERAHVPST